MADATKPKNPTSPSGPTKVKKLVIKVDRDLCIGAATCVSIAHKTFALDNEAKSIIIETAEDETEDVILEAAKSCPTAAISVEDEKGNRVYPK